MSMAQRVDAQSGYEVEILLAFEVVEEDTFAALKAYWITVVGGEKETLFEIDDLFEAGHGLIVNPMDTGPLYNAPDVSGSVRGSLPTGLAICPGVFWIQAGCGHDGSSQLLGRNGKLLGWRLAGGSFFRVGRDEAIASSNHCLQVLRLAGVIGQRAANLADGGVDPLFDVDEYVLAPQGRRDFFSRDHLTALLDQEHEQLQRQSLEPNRGATMAELEATVIELELVEADFLIRQCPAPVPRSPATNRVQQTRFNKPDRTNQVEQTGSNKRVVRNSVLPRLPCQARNREFLQINSLQINSDGFILSPWTFTETRRMITLTCGI